MVMLRRFEPHPWIPGHVYMGVSIQSYIFTVCKPIICAEKILAYLKVMPWILNAQMSYICSLERSVLSEQRSFYTPLTETYYIIID